MEKIRIKSEDFEIISISKNGNLLIIEFPAPVNLVGKNLSIIELHTSGGAKCATLEGYGKIHATNGNKVTLINENLVVVGNGGGGVAEVSLAGVKADIESLKTESIMTIEALETFLVEFVPMIMI